ncbi:hypothetical protein EDD18DRAFT_1325904 [Armillaria luteobubalina]|uniref:Uncharacterized protein n=1 Tax=Armillaria luteobubalina TaxID=153913 RepID=A0AA39QQZ0_9AGAR|nr:hypothetical protein EDD18DRAFT_1325904 [Armillaria luteobubalina]
MHAVVKKELEGKEWNIVKLYKEKVVHPDKAEVEEHFAIIDAPLGWWFIGIRWLLIDEVYACGVLYIVHVHGEQQERYTSEWTRSAVGSHSQRKERLGICLAKGYERSSPLCYIRTSSRNPDDRFGHQRRTAANTVSTYFSAPVVIPSCTNTPFSQTVFAAKPFDQSGRDIALLGGAGGREESADVKQIIDECAVPFQYAEPVHTNILIGLVLECASLSGGDSACSGVDFSAVAVLLVDVL